MKTRKPPKKRNPIAKNINKFNKPQVVPSKYKEERQETKRLELEAYHKGNEDDGY